MTCPEVIYNFVKGKRVYMRTAQISGFDGENS